MITPELSSTSTVDKFPTRLECRFSFSFSTSVCMMEFLRLNIIAVSDVQEVHMFLELTLERVRS